MLFLPTYSPWLNPTEMLWLSLHETITRNYQRHYMWQLLKQVNQFMRAASPFPGNQPELAKVERYYAKLFRFDQNGNCVSEADIAALP
ncbi:transposase [Erwinia persicina]|nr:transposase [Erwinia persicina]